MSRLLRVELKISGKFRELWLYRGWLLLWDRSGVLHYASLDAINKHVTRSQGLPIANLVQTLVFRNDWKVGEQFVSWMRVPEVSAALLAPFADDDAILVTLPDHLFIPNESEAFGGLVLDTSIYANRIYFATAEGLLESYIHPRYPRNSYGLYQHTDFRASRVSVKYSAINVSAEAKGLHFAPVRFWLQENDDDPSPTGKVDWRQVADFSLATSFARRNLLNYTNSSVPLLLQSRIEERRNEGARYDDASIIGYEPDAVDLTSLTYSAATSTKRVTARRAAHAPDLGNFEVLGNSDYHLLVSWGDRLDVIDLRAEAGHEVEARRSRKFQSTELAPTDLNEVIATYAISRGFVVETYDRLDLITVDGIFRLLDGEVAQVRTFESSIRHKEAVAVVQEESASVLGFYVLDDHDNALF